MTIILRAPIIILKGPIMILRVSISILRAPIIILRAPSGIPPAVEDCVCLGRSVGRAFRDVLRTKIASQVFHCVLHCISSYCMTERKHGDFLLFFPLCVSGLSGLCFGPGLPPRCFFACLLKLHV